MTVRLSDVEVSMRGKSDDITAIQRLLDMPCINGCILTIDRYTKNIAEKVVSKSAHYILFTVVEGWLRKSF